SFADEMGGITLAVDDSLILQRPVPKLKQEIDPESENADVGSSEEEEGTVWLPVPLEFVLVNVEDGREIDSEQAIEWLPEDYLYLALFWISVCGMDRGDVKSNLVAPSSISGEKWITEVVHCLRPLDNGQSKSISEDVLRHPIT